MKKLFGGFLGIAVLCLMTVAAISANDEKANKPKEATTQDQAKQRVMSDLTLMQNQEVRVIVLQQVLTREVAELRQSQAVFCDQYKLDCEKWRQGLYRYDEKQGKFVETPETPAAK